MRSHDTLPESLAGILDSALALATDGPGPHVASADVAEQPLVGRLAVHDTDLPLLRGSTAPLEVVLGGGAGQVAGPAGLCSRLGLNLAGVRLALRDYDDLAGNVRRVAAAVEAARGNGDLAEDVPVCVDLPIAESPYGWQGALDEAAMVELEVGFRLGGNSGVPDPHTVASWIDAALDRETRFRVTVGLDQAVRAEADGQLQHGLLNVLLATKAAWDGAGADAVSGLLAERDGAALATQAAAATSARRWFVSSSTAAVTTIAAELEVLGLFNAS